MSALPTAIAAAVVIHDHRVLVQTRPAGRSWAGWWEFPGGKIEPGEDAPACAVRECREELDLEVRALELLHHQPWETPGFRVAVTFVRCEMVDPSPGLPRPQDGQQVRWASREDLGRMQFLPANAEVLRILSGCLGSVSSS